MSPLQHYLPATYIACFSHDEEPTRRNRMVAVGDRQQGVIWEDRAGNVAGIKNIYPEFIDNNWAFYEASLGRALNDLISGSIDAVSWGRIIVPFVAGIFVRGPDFSKRYTQRLLNLLGDPSPEIVAASLDMSRVFEFQILVANLLAFEWNIVRTIGSEELLTNDLGYAPFMLAHTGQIGISVPIGHRHAIQIMPRGKSCAAVIKSGRWVPALRYVDLQPDNHVGLNYALARYSQRFIFGSAKDLVRRYLRSGEDIPRPLEPDQLGFRFGSDELKYTWYTFISAVSHEPGTSLILFDQDAFLSGPCPSVQFVSSDLFANNSTVYRKGQSIYVSLGV